jgi:drug/metabolite transporter (DMT)-like permease
VSRRGWLLFAAMGLIWGIPYLLIKVAVGGLHPVTLVLMRTALGSLLLVPLAARRNELRPLLPYWRPLILYTLVEVAIPWFLLSDAERRLSSSLTGLMVAAVPLIGAVLAWLTGGQDRPAPRRLAGLVVGLIGVGALVGLDVSVHDLGAVGEVGLVALGYATGPMIISRSLSRAPSVGVVAASLVLTAVLYAPLGLTQMPARFSPQVLLAVAVLGIVCTALAFLIFFALIAEAGPVRATVITYVNPAVALALGVTVLHEPFTLGAAVGFALILAGSVLSTQRARSPRPAPVIAAEYQPEIGHG